MKIIKLDAIDSTNSFLKDLAQNTLLESETVVVTKEQFKGRGQMGTNWSSEPNKNLLCSVYYKFDNLAVLDQFYLNFAVALSVFQALEVYDLPKLSIKWPNDILSERDKICGVLVENVIISNRIQSTVIGIGLNVNQEKFSLSLPNVTSIKKRTSKEVDIDKVLDALLVCLRKNLKLLEEGKREVLEEQYLKVLYKKNIPTMFKDSENVLFIGIIIGVTSYGKLQIQLDDDSIKEFGIKEVSLA